MDWINLPFTTLTGEDSPFGLLDRRSGRYTCLGDDRGDRGESFLFLSPSMIPAKREGGTCLALGAGLSFFERESPDLEEDVLDDCIGGSKDRCTMIY